MELKREPTPFSAISGTMVRLSDRELIAIHRWNDLSWVAHFHDGCAELSDAATWFKGNAAQLRSRWVGSPSALKAVEILTPEMIARIAQLHQRAAEERARRDATSAALVAALRRACAQAVLALRGWRVRLLPRNPPETGSPGCTRSLPTLPTHATNRGPDVQRNDGSDQAVPGHE